jgi:hypothetical protein
MNSTVAATNTRFADHAGAATRTRQPRSGAIAVAEIAALVLITVALIAATIMTSNHTRASVSSERVRVERGQTLWQLAVEHPVAGLTTEQTAQLISSVNHIADGQVAAGKTIDIPAHIDGNLALASR